MLQLLHDITGSSFFYFGTGILLIVLFIWYLASENDRIKRNAGTFFILGLSSFTLLSLFVNGMHYGIDIRGGTELTLEVQPKLDSNGNMTPPTEQDMQQACDILGERLNSSGTSEVQIIHSNNKILIQIPQQDSDEERNREKTEAMVKMLTKMAKLELLYVYPESESVIAHPGTQEALAQYEKRAEAYREALARGEKGLRAPVLPRIPTEFGLNDYQILPYPRTDNETGEPILNKQGKQVIDYMVLQKPYAAMQRDVYITGKEVSRAQPNYTRRGLVDVTLNGDGADRMRRFTGSVQLGRDRMAVVLNGQVKCAPVVSGVFGKDFQISGLNAKGEPEDISKALANPLSSDLVVEGRKDVSAQLGQAALDQGIYAGIVGLIGIFIFCYWYYRSAGMIAMVGLALNALALIGLMSLFGFVLTLPGIAGIVLTMGMAVDANVLIYERMREESKLGRPFIICLRNAYDKAFSAIWDSNITSLITAVILFWLASGSIKGFAVTTSVGIITSLIGAVVVTRVLFFWAEHLNLLKNFSFGRPPFYGKSYNFMKYGRKAGVASVVAILICVGYMFGLRGEKALGVDFTGGATLTYVIPAGADIDYSKVEQIVDESGLPLEKKANAQEFGSDATGRNIKIRCAGKKDAQIINEALRREVPGMDKLPEASVDEVSSSLGSSFFKTACWALLAGMVGITLYLSVRFEWTFAMGALISIFHDVILTIGIVILMGTELNVIHVGAFLTVAGYSINDTIVIYDRIREALRLAAPGDDLREIFNEAINSTLSRTLLTSMSTVAVLIALILLGGSSMRDFSVCMLIGIFVGTYSSIYIASPIVLYFCRKHDLRGELQQAAEDETTA